MPRLEVASVDIEGVGQRLERVKGYSDRKNDLNVRKSQIPSPQRPQHPDVVEKEGRVLEGSQKPEVHRQASHQAELANSRPGAPMHPLREEPIRNGRDPQQRYEGRVPRGVERVAHDEQEALPDAPWKPKPAEDQDDDQEDQEAKGVEKHVRLASCPGAALDWAGVLAHSGA